MGAPSITIDATQVRELDTYGAWLLERLSRSVPAQRVAIAAPSQFHAILEEVHTANPEVPASPKISWWRAQFDWLANKLADAPEVSECVTKQWFRFSLGRVESTDDACSLQAARDAFRAAGGNVKTLLAQIALSDAFRNVRSTEK